MHRLLSGSVASGLALALTVSMQPGAIAGGIELDSPGNSTEEGITESELSLKLRENHPATRVGVVPQDDRVWTGLPVLGTDGDGEYCIGRNWVRLPIDEVEQAEHDALFAIAYIFGDVPELAGLQPTEDCPVDPNDDVPPEMLEDVVRETLVDVLPRPEPTVPPGYAMTGMAAYLVTDHELTYGPVDHEVDLEIMQLTVRVAGEGTTTVDWGDGTEPRTYDEPGLPYPEGSITHTYADTGNVAIEVTDTWRLNYDVYRGGTVIISDVVEFDLAPVSLEELEVRELQAVRTSSN